MEKVPFTTDGVNRKQAELYTLPQSDLDAQADLILKQFKTWVTDNFELTPDQQDYLKAMDAQSELYLSNETSASVRVKLPVRVSITPPVEGDSSKLFSCNRTVKFATLKGVTPPIEGEFAITITWQK